MQDLEAHSQFMRNLAHSLLGNEHDAEDLVQSAQLGFLQSPGEHVRSPRNWLATILRRRGSNLLRSKTVQLQAERAAAKPESDPGSPLVLERLELQQKVLAAVVALDPKYREVINLRYYEELTPAEIAVRADIPVSTVKTRLQRAVLQLRERLDLTCDGDRDMWCAVLAPLIGGHWIPRTPSLAPAPLTIGALVLNTKPLLSAAALLVSLGGWLAWSALDEQPIIDATKATQQEVALESPADQEPVDQVASFQKLVDPSHREALDNAESDAGEDCDWLLSGTVNDQKDNAVPYASFTLRFLGPWSSGLEQVRCDKQGRYELKLNAPSAPISPRSINGFRIAIEAQAPEHIVTSTRFDLPKLVPNSSTPATPNIVVRPGYSARGLIIDRAGVPVPEARIILLDAKGASLRTNSTDSFGVYSLRLPDQRQAISVSAWHPDKGIVYSKAQMPGAEDLQFPDLSLVQTETLKGQITSPDGVPFKNLKLRFAKVQADAAESPNSTPPETRGHGLTQGTGQTDASGRFEIHGVAQGQYTLTTVAAVLGPVERLQIGKAQTGVFFEGTLRIYSLRLTIVDELGLPLPGSSANIMQGLGGLFSRVYGADASVEKWVTPGDWQLSASFEGAPTTRETITIGEEQYRTEIELVVDFSRSTGRVQIYAKDDLDRQVNGYSLKITDLLEPNGRSEFRPVEVDAQGLTAPLPCGEYRYQIYTDNPSIKSSFERNIQGRLEVLAGETVELNATLPLGGRFQIECSTSDGSEVPVQVECAELATGASLSIPTLWKQLEGGGRAYGFGGIFPGSVNHSEILTPGAWTVRLSAEGYDDYQSEVQLRAGEFTRISVQLRKR